MKTINVGVIGFGYIGKVHTVAYRDIPLCIGRPKVKANLTALLRTGLETDREAMQASGYQVCTTSTDEFYDQPLDLVDVCTPNYLHMEQCQLALENGTAVYCEKPLGVNYKETCALTDLAEKAGAITQVAYVLRYLPAVRQMKTLVETGEIGEVLTFRGHMFHGSYLDPSRPMSWRLRQSESGGGAFMDLGSHLVDLTLYILGAVKSVGAQIRTLISERHVTGNTSLREKVDVDDWALCTLELTNGAIGAIEVTRMAAGAGEESGFEIYGSKGSLRYRESNPNAVQHFSLLKGKWTSVPFEIPSSSGERTMERVWPSSKYSQGLMTNAHMAAQYDLLLNIAEKKPSLIDFRAASKVQQVIEAAYSSARMGGEVYKLE